MDRLDLVPRASRAERLFLLDVLAGTHGPMEVDRERFLEITPKKLHPLVHARLGLPETAAAHRVAGIQALRRGLELRRIQTALSGAGIRWLILKGPVLAASVYSDPAARTMTDLDLLLAEEDLPQATKAMEAAGFRVPLQFAGFELAAGETAPLLHDQPGGPSIEIHTMLDSLPDEPLALEKTWPSARTVSLGHGVEMMALSRPEFFLHVVAHVSKHHRFEGELRSLLDVALLLRADADALDWDSLVPEWERRGLLDWVALTATLAHLLLGAPLPRILATRRVPDEALVLAAEQLWIVEKARVHQRITHSLAGRRPAPVHAAVGARRAPSTGLRSHLARELSRVRRVLSDVRRGNMRAAIVSSEVELFRKRERLFELVEEVSATRRSR